jgi:RNase H-like domain found in reverse transcriptase
MNYNTTELELLAIVWSVRHFRPYLFGKHFTIKTDHRPLIYLFGLADPSSRLNKFRMFLQSYMYTVVYVKGKENGPADALSRIEIKSEELNNLRRKIEESKVLVVTRLQEKLNKERESAQEDLGNETNNDEISSDGNIVMCELLKKPKWVTEIKILRHANEKKRNEYKRNKIVIANRAENLWFVAKEQTIDLVIPKGETDYVSFLQGLPEFCKKLKITDLALRKAKENREAIAKIKEIRVITSKSYKGIPNMECTGSNK